VNPYTRAAQSIIRLLAFGLVIFSFCLYASDVFLSLSHRPVSRPASLALKGLPFLAGLVLFWKSSGLALYLTRDLD
jgi:hypothetical protein